MREEGSKGLQSDVGWGFGCEDEDQVCGGV